MDVKETIKDTEVPNSTNNEQVYKENEIAETQDVIKEFINSNISYNCRESGEFIDSDHAKNRKVTSRNVNALFLLLRIIFNKGWTKSILLCLLLISVEAHKEQKFAIEPQDQSAVIGSRVTLPCRVENKVGQLQWTKDDFGLGTHRHLVGYERYKMVGSDEEGDYSLDIRDVSLEDDASYQCQVSSGPRGEPPIRSRYAQLTVLVPPDPPKILEGSELQAIEDNEVTLSCVSVGGKPAAEITWVDSDGGVLTQGVNNTVEAMVDGRRFTARSVLHLRPRRHHHNQTFTCQAQNTADRAYKAATVKLRVQYAPRVRVFIKSGVVKGMIQEGDTLNVGCQAHANPNDLKYKWYVNNDRVISENDNELVITNVTRNYNEATIKCEVYNSVGKSADTKTLEVAYAPIFKVRPQNIEGDVGLTATLNCVVDSHPQPKYTWLRYNHENNNIFRVGKSSILNVTVSKHTAGQYWCKASVEGYPDIEASVMVYVKGPPKIMSNQTQYGIEGDSARVECISFSVPKPDYVMWTFGGNEINSFHNQEYAFLEESLADGVTKSTLIIRESESKHFGLYNCSVTNSYGTDDVQILLIPDKSFPLVVVISGSASAVIVILTLVLIVILCKRKNKKTDLVKNPDITDIGKLPVDPFKDSDRSSNISDLKMELRQVQGSCDVDNVNGGSETEFHSNLHLTSNLGLPLAGPVPLPEAGFDNELIKQYQRYSGDFNQPIKNLNFKNQSQSNGYVPYVDYSRDYAPPVAAGETQTSSLSRSKDLGYNVNYGSLHRQTIGKLDALAEPDVIQMANSGVLLAGGVDVRYAATYGNPYLRGSGPISYATHVNSGHPGANPAPPPYYSVRNSNLALPVTSGASPCSSSSSSRPVTSSLASSISNGGAQPQVPKLSPKNPGALYVLPPSSQGNITSQITVKGNGPQTAGTHV